MDRDELTNRFAYHPPTSEAVVRKHERTRALLFDVALHFDEDLPEGREKSLVMTHLEEAMMWANAAIARQQPPT